MVIVMRRPSYTLTCEFDLMAETRELIKHMGDDPDARGVTSRYIEDAIRVKNMLIKANKWVPAEDIDPKKVKLR